MALISTVGEIPGLHADAFMLWDRLIQELHPDDLYNHFSPILVALLDLYTLFDARGRMRISDVIWDMIRRCDADRITPYMLPVIPDFDDLRSLKVFADEKQQMLQPEDIVMHFLTQAKSYDVASTSLALDHLKTVLENHGPLHEAILQHQSGLISTLLLLSRRNIDQRIHREAAICLGMLGAVDPSRCNVEPVDETLIIINFGSDSETRRFILKLIIAQLIPAFHAANDTLIHQRLQYTMQTLLKLGGFSDNMEKRTQDGQDTREAWRAVPIAAKALLTPLLRSSYKATYSCTPQASPIYPTTSDFQAWVQTWYFQLQAAMEGRTKAIFDACIPVVISGNTTVTSWLLPYMVSHVLFMGSPEDRKSITLEVESVLEINSRPDMVNETLRQLSLQVRFRAM